MSYPQMTNRHWQIFRAVERDGDSLETAAEAVGVTVEQAEAMLREAFAWHRDTASGWLQRLDPYDQAMVMWRLHDERMETLFREAMNAWHESRGLQTIKRERGGVTTTSTTMSFGQTRYLQVAARIAQMRIQALEHHIRIAEKYPAPPRPDEATSPPTGGCARESGSEADEAADDTDVVSLNIAAQEVYDDEPTVSLPVREPQNDFTTPVRATMPPLNRKQKRALERRKRRALRSSK